MSQFGLRLELSDSVADHFGPNQDPTPCHLDILVQVVPRKWQDVDSRYHFANLVLLSFLCGGYLVYPGAAFGHGAPVLEILPSRPTRAEFIIRLRSNGNWDRLCSADLTYNNVKPVRSSQRLEGVQERLRRKRFIEEEVRAVLPCSRPPDLRCSRYMRRSRTLWDTYR